MSSNKKIAITSAVLILLIIITAASIIAIFAAAQQTVNSEVSVTYKSEYVSGTASAKYYVGEADKTGTAMRVNGEAEGATSIEFNSRNANQNATLSPVEKEIKLSEENYFVVFEYYFTNTNSQNDYMATLTTSDSNVKNMTVTTATSDERVEDFSTINSPVSNVTTLSLGKLISASSNGYVYVKVEISNLDNDADFKINFNWNLGKPPIDIWSTSAKTFNTKYLNSILQKISGDDSVSISNMSKIEELAQNKTTAKQMRELAANNGAISISDTKAANEEDNLTVTFGGLNWTITYLSTDKDGNPILTLWLDNCIQDAWKNRQADEGENYGFINGGLYSDWSVNFNIDDYDHPSNMYGTSYIRAKILNNGGQYVIYKSSESYLTNAEQNSNSVFAQFTMEEFGLTKYLVKPRQVEWQEKGQSTKNLFNFDYDFENENWSQSAGGDYSKKENNDAWADDYLWLPSISETGYDDSHIGIWDLSAAQRYNADGTTSNGKQVGTSPRSSNNNTWLRTSYLGEGGWMDIVFYVCILNPSGTNYSYDWSCSDGQEGCDAVRPALHLNLRAIAQDL